MIRKLFIISLCMALVACGYHLSGTQKGESKMFSARIKQISIDGIGRYDPLRQNLVSALRPYGFEVVQHSNASVHLIVENKDIRQTAAVIGNEAKVREYLLTMTVQFKVLAREKSEVLLKNQTARAETFFRHDATEILISANLQRSAEARLEEQITRDIINRLATIVPRKSG